MRNEEERLHDVSLGPDPFSNSLGSGGGTAVAEGQVHVIHGVYSHDLPLAGMTVRQARIELADRMNIDPEAMAVVDGDELDEDTVLAEGQVLTFVKHAGEKG